MATTAEALAVAPRTFALSACNSFADGGWLRLKMRLSPWRRARQVLAPPSFCDIPQLFNLERLGALLGRLGALLDRLGGLSGLCETDLERSGGPKKSSGILETSLPGVCRDLAGVLFVRGPPGPAPRARTRNTVEQLPEILARLWPVGPANLSYYCFLL